MNLYAWAVLQGADDVALCRRQAPGFAFQLEEHDARRPDQDQVGETSVASPRVGVVVAVPAEQVCSWLS